MTAPTEKDQAQPDLAIQESGQSLGLLQVITDLMRHHELLHTVSADGERDFVLTDMLTPRGESSITLGIEEVDHLAECVVDAISAACAALNQGKDQ